MTTEFTNTEVPYDDADSMFIGDDDFSSLFTDEALAMGDDKAAEVLSERHAKKQAAKAKGKTSEDFTWDIDDDPFYHLDEDADDDIDDDDDELDETSDIRDTSTDDEDDDLDPLSYFSELPDEIEIAPGYTKAALTDLIRSKDEFTQQAEYMKHQFNKFEEGNEYIKQILGHNLTETNKTIHAIKQALDNPHTDTVRKGQLYQELQLQEGKLRTIESDWQQAEGARKVQEQYADEQRWFQTNLALDAELGRGWNANNSVIEYAVSSGIPVQVLQKTVSPELMKMFIKAMKFDKGQVDKASKFNDVVAKAARSTASSKASDKAQNTSSIRRKEQTIKAARSGDARAVSDMFDMLED